MKACSYNESAFIIIFQRSLVQNSDDCPKPTVDPVAVQQTNGQAGLQGATGDQLHRVLLPVPTNE